VTARPRARPAYGQSKTADALLAVEATRRWSGEGIYANALNPGAIATGLQKHTGGLKTPKDRQKTVQQGAATSVLLAASPLGHRARPADGVRAGVSQASSSPLQLSTVG
jgi:NAD(P)-dependent dehydrogenase (short-subunit alcohol dehydrogenase family)